MWSPRPPAATASKVNPATSLQATLTSSELVVGANRFTFALVDGNHPVNTLSPRLDFFHIRGKMATHVESRTASFNHFARGLTDNAANSTAIEIGGVYVAHPYFGQAGTWGIELRAVYKGKRRRIRQTFSVRRYGVTPAVGSAAPRSNSPTSPPVSVAKLDSGKPPDDMHKLSIAEAIGDHKPTVVLFSTPGFCTSRMCGPETQVVEGLEQTYRTQVNFIHIEIYKDANPAKGYAPTVIQWHLQTEPWVFVLDRRGAVAAKFEGPTPASEIKPAIQHVLR